MGFDGDFSMYSKWFNKKISLTQKDNFVQIAEHRYQVETSFFSPDGALLRWVGTLTYTVMGQQMHRPLQLITQRFAKCLQNVWKTVKDGWKELTINAFFSQESVWGGGLHGREAPSQWQVTSTTRFTTQLLVDLDFIFLLNFSCRCTTTLEGRSDRH